MRRSSTAPTAPAIEFLADIVLDARSDQPADRRATAHRDALVARRSSRSARRAAEAALRRILAEPSLSADVRDIAARSLG